MERKRFRGLLNENVGGGLARIIAKALTKNIDEVSTPIKKIILSISSFSPLLNFVDIRLKIKSHFSFKSFLIFITYNL